MLRIPKCFLDTIINYRNWVEKGVRFQNILGKIVFITDAGGTGSEQNNWVQKAEINFIS